MFFRAVNTEPDELKKNAMVVDRFRNLLPIVLFVIFNLYYTSTMCIILLSFTKTTFHIKFYVFLKRLIVIICVMHSSACIIFMIVYIVKITRGYLKNTSIFVIYPLVFFFFENIYFMNR